MKDKSWWTDELKPSRF